MNERTSEGGALTELILETFRLNGALLAAGNQITKPYGLTSARWQVMGAINLEGKALTVSQIARRMGLSRQAVQRVVNDLVSMEMVVLKENLDHKRAPLVTISEAGKVVMKEIDKSQTAWVNDLSKGFKENQLVQALKVLQDARETTEKFNQNIQEK